MSDFSTLLGGNTSINKIISDARDPGTLFRDASWEQVGTNKELTDFLHKSLDPNGSLYGGDTEALKTDILNKRTATGSSALASIWDWAQSKGEVLPKKQFENLLGRLYDSAPNRLTSGDASQTAEVIGAALKGGVVYDAPLMALTALGKGAYAASKILPLGETALKEAGVLASENAAKSAAAKIAATDASVPGAQAVGDAIGAAGDDLVREMARQGRWKIGGAEAVENAAIGALGDVGQQNAAIERGSQDEYSIGQLAMNAGGGAVLGGLVGAAQGHFAGKKMGNELADALPTGVGKVQAAEAEAAARAASGAADAEVPFDFLTPADQWAKFSGGMSNAASDLEQFANKVQIGTLKSKYSPEQLDVLTGSISHHGASNRMSSALLKEAARLEAKGDPTSIALAAQKRQEAASYEAFIREMATGEFGDGNHLTSSLFKNGDIDRGVIETMAKFDRSVAEAFGIQPEEGAGYAGQKAKKPAPTQPGGSPAEPAATGEATPNSLEQAATTPPAKPLAEVPTAEDVKSMAETVFTQEEKDALNTLSDIMQKGNTDLQTVLDAIATSGQSKVVGDLAKTASTERGAVADAVTKVTGAAKREHAKAKAEADAAAAKAAEAPKATTEAPAAEAATAPEAAAAEAPAAEPAPKTDLDEMIEAAAVNNATQNFVLMRDTANQQVNQVLKAVTDAISSTKAAMAKEDLKYSKKEAAEEIQTAIQTELAKLKSSNPELTPIIDVVAARNFSTEKGMAAVKAHLEVMAKRAVAFTYAKVIGNIMPDAFDYKGFGVIIDSMLRGIPKEEVRFIADTYKELVKEALIDRVNAIGIKAVQSDAKLGPAWNSLFVAGNDWYQTHGGKTKIEFDIEKVLENHVRRIKDSVGTDEAKTKMIANVKKSVREMAKSLQDGGVLIDPDAAYRILDMRALFAAEYELTSKFYELNKGDFEKLNKLREMRADGEFVNYAGRESFMPNPIIERMADGSDKLVSGRTQPRDIGGQPGVGRPQSILSDGISDYLGTLWAHPRKLISASAVARRAIYDAAVQNASWSRGSMVIDGVRVTKSMKELKGLMAERIAQRMEQSRDMLILDSVQKHIDGTLTDAELASRLESIGSRSRKVEPYETYAARQIIEANQRMKAAQDEIGASIEEVLKNAENLGENAGQHIARLVQRMEETRVRQAKTLFDNIQNARREMGDKTLTKGGGKEKGTPASGAKTSKQSANSATVVSEKALDGTERPVVSPAASDDASITVRGYAFSPKDVVSFDPDGVIRLFGEKIGTWVAREDGGSNLVASIPGFDDAYKVSTFKSLVGNKRFIKTFDEKFKSNLSKGAKTVADHADGTEIPKEASPVAVKEEAVKEVLNPASLKESDLGKTLSDFGVEEGYKLVLKDKSTGKYIVPSAGQMGQSMSDFLQKMGLRREDVEVGRSLAGKVNSQGKMVNTSKQVDIDASFKPIGSEVPAASKELLEAAVRKSEKPDVLAKAKFRPLSESEAATVMMPDGMSLLETYNLMRSRLMELDWSQIPDLESLNRTIASYAEITSKIDALAPHGIKMPNASRRMSFHYLRESLSKFSREEMESALDILRRMETDRSGLPYFGKKDNMVGAALTFSRSTGNSKIIMGDKPIAGMPRHVEVAHEIGHWGFHELLSNTDRIEFLQSLAKYYGADGKLSLDLLNEAMTAASQLEKTHYKGKPFMGRLNTVNELFAWQFKSYVLQKTTNQTSFDSVSSVGDLWNRITKLAKNVLQYFLGQNLDKDMVPLFEKIMPSTIAEKKFHYSSLIDENTGLEYAVSELPASRDYAKNIVTVMEKIDELRGRMRYHLLGSSDVDAAFIADTETAAKHMFGLLYGRDPNYLRSNVVSGLRDKLKRTTANMLGDDRWERGEPRANGKPGKIIKVPEMKYNPATGRDEPTGRMVPKIKQAPILGQVNPNELFSRTSTGKLMSAIRDILPEGMGEGLAFEAAVGQEGFNVVVKDMAGVDTAVLEQYRIEVLREAFERITKKDMRDIPAASEAQYREALDKAEIEANKAAAEFAMSEYQVDINEAAFGGGDRVVLGSAQQKEAFGEMARNLHDMMSDALDHLESKLNGANLIIKRNINELPASDAKAAAAFDETAAKVKTGQKKSVLEEAPAPVTEKSAQVAKQEESERVLGEVEGVPSAANPQWKSIISRVPHRDATRNDVIGTLMYRIFGFITEGSDEAITNAHIATLVGDKLETGVLPNAGAADTTMAFDKLRNAMRMAAAKLTTPGESPMDAVEIIAGMLSRARRDAFNAEFEGVLDMNAAGEPKPLSAKTITKAVMSMFGIGEMPSNYPVDAIHFAEELASNIEHIVSGLGKSQAAKNAVGKTVETAGRSMPVKYPDGNYHAAMAKSSVQTRLAQLPVRVAQRMMDDLGIVFSGDLAKELGDRIVYMLAAGRRTVYSTADAMLAALGNEKVHDGTVIPMIVDRTFLYNPEKMTTAAKVAVETKMAEVGGKLDDALKQLGYIGREDGGVVKLFSGKSAHKLEDAIAKATEAITDGSNPDVPMLGEVVLNMSIDTSVPINPLAVEQRALEAGAPQPVAKVLSKFFKKRTEDAVSGLNEKDQNIVRKFSGLQIRSNASRILKDGGVWLAGKIERDDGTGFFDKLFPSMGETLSEPMHELDNLTGLRWWNRPVHEMRRNIDMRDHKIWQSEPEERIAMAMRTGDTSKLQGVKELTALAKVKKMFADLLEMQQKAGIPVADVTDKTNPFYLPQRFNVDWLRANTEEAVKMLGEWFAKDRKREGLPVGDAMGDARQVIHEAMNREELQGIIDSSSSTYARAFGDKLHKRKLRIVGDEWEKMAPMFDNNLRSLMVSYAEAAHKRVRWAEEFGIRGHAANTYVEIAQNGDIAAKSALMSEAKNMKYAIGRTDEGIELEAVSSLFRPFTTDEYEARNIVDSIVKYLDTNGKDVGTRKGLVDILVNRYESEGGYGVIEMRKRLDSIVNGLADFGRDGGTVAEHEADFMLKTVATLGGRPAYTISANHAARKTAAAVKTFNSVTLLSGTTLSSLPDMAGSLFRSGSGAAWIKSMAKVATGAMKDPATAAALRRIGVAMESILSENLSHVNGGLSGRVSNVFFQATLLAPWTNAQRQFAALTGFEAIKANQAIIHREKMAGNIGGYKYRRSMRFLRQLGLASLADAEKLDTLAGAVNISDAASDAEREMAVKVSEAIHKFVNESVFQPNRNDVPLWAQDPIASMLWQFKSYPMMMGRLVKRNFREALAFENGKYAGDPMGLMYLLTAGSAAGLGVTYAKDRLLGRNEEDGADPYSMREYRLSSILGNFGMNTDEMDKGSMDLILGTYAQGLLQLGSLGMLGDIAFQSAQSIDNGAQGQQRIASQIAGPTFGLFNDTLTVAAGIHHAAMHDEEDESNAKERAAVRTAMRRVPFLGPQRKIVNEWVDTFAGEAQTPPPQQ